MLAGESGICLWMGHIWSSSTLYHNGNVLAHCSSVVLVSHDFALSPPLKHFVTEKCLSLKQKKIHLQKKWVFFLSHTLLCLFISNCHGKKKLCRGVTIFVWSTAACYRSPANPFIIQTEGPRGFVWMWKSVKVDFTSVHATKKVNDLFREELGSSTADTW